jgi:hypothetical protein
MSGVAALVLAFRGNFESSFIVAVIGATSWFLHYRVGIKEKLTLSEEQNREKSEPETDEEE